MRLILGFLLYLFVALPALAVYTAAQKHGWSEWAAMWVATPVFVGTIWWFTDGPGLRIVRRLRAGARR